VTCSPQLSAAVVAAITAALGAGLATTAWADPVGTTPTPHHSQRHEPVLPKPRSGAIINRGPLDPLEIAGAKSALDRLAFATKFLSTSTTGTVVIPPYLPGGEGERITVTFGNAPNTSAPVTQRYALETGTTFEHAFPLRGQNHSELMTVVFSDDATELQVKRAGSAWIG
jgi:hypothetical protein